MDANAQQLKFKIKGPGSRTGTKANLILKKGVYGGQVEHRKFARPFSATKAVHIIFRSRLLSGARSLLRANRKEWTEEILKQKTRHYGAKLYSFSVNSNHIHLLMKFPTPQSQSRFLRDATGSLALKIKTTFKISKNTKVWDARPFSSLVKCFPRIKAYIEKNKNEATGLWPYKKRTISYLSQVLGKIDTFRLNKSDKNYSTFYNRIRSTA